MRPEPVQFLADIRLGREQQRLLGQPILAEAGARTQQVGDLLLEPRQNGVAAAARVRRREVAG